MGIIVNKQDQRTKLRDKVEASLRDRAKQEAQINTKDVDLIDDSKFQEGTHKSWFAVWVFVIALFVAAVLVFAFVNSQ